MAQIKPVHSVEYYTFILSGKSSEEQSQEHKMEHKSSHSCVKGPFVIVNSYNFDYYTAHPQLNNHDNNQPDGSYICCSSLITRVELHKLTEW